MDNNFQTSFIPKKPLAEERAQVIHHSSILSFIATLIFFAALAAAAGLYFYKANLVKNITSESAQLDAARNAFEPSLITTLQTLNRRITDANLLLNNHIVVSPIFAALQVNTLKSVQFTKFSYVSPTDTTTPIEVKMSGVARDYSSIALQSDQLATNPNIHNSIFSNLVLDQKTGMVSFDLTFTIDQSLVRFVDNLNNLTDNSTDQSGTGTADAGSTTGGTAGQQQAQAPVQQPAATGTTGTGTTGTQSGGTTGSSLTDAQRAQIMQGSQLQTGQ